MFKTLFEAPEAEAARLALSPVSSINHDLSVLPVNIDVYVEGLMIQMPRMHADDTHTMIVVPYQAHKANDAEIAARQELPRKRHLGWWSCIVVASDHPSYPVNNRISVPQAQLVRGTVRSLALAPVAEDAWIAPYEEFDKVPAGEGDERVAFQAGFVARDRLTADQ